MGRLLIAAGFSSALLIPTNALAQEATDGLTTDAEVLTPTEQVRKLVEGELDYQDVSKEVQELLSGISDLKNADRAGRLAALMFLLAAFFKILLSGLKLMGNLSIWKVRQAAVIRIVTLVLAICVYSMANLLAGMPWWEALALSLSGPGSMVVHEYSRLFGGGSKEA